MMLDLDPDHTPPMCRDVKEGKMAVYLHLENTLVALLMSLGVEDLENAKDEVLSGYDAWEVVESYGSTS